MEMRNVMIQVKKKDYIVVTADTERFGDNEVMYEGNTFTQCFDYCKRELGLKKLRLRSYVSEPYVDRDGRAFPARMEVLV